MNRIAGKIALITGAAKGLGAADARLFAAEGATVIVADVDDDAGAAVAAAIGPAAEYRHLDVRHEAEWEALIGDVVARHGRLDILVNNAGVVELGTPEHVLEAHYRFIMAVSVDGVVFGTKHAIRAMRASGGGAIVNMASIAAIQGECNVAAYCAAKGAVDAYTRATAVYCTQQRLNIRANSILPAGIDTPMIGSFMGKFTASHDPHLITNAASAANRLGVPEDVANLTLFLASDESRFINGQSHVIDDGASITTGVTVA
jgi:3(or 17)beta-hydroxysteroid dehydrogenase